MEVFVGCVSCAYDSGFTFQPTGGRFNVQARQGHWHCALHRKNIIAMMVASGVLLCSIVFFELSVTTPDTEVLWRS